MKYKYWYKIKYYFTNVESKADYVCIEISYKNTLPNLAKDFVDREQRQ